MWAPLTMVPYGAKNEDCGFFQKCSYCHFPNTEHLVAERSCLCTSWGRVKPFRSWLLLGLPNASPLSCLGDFFAHLSSQVVSTFHLLPLLSLLQNDLAGNEYAQNKWVWRSQMTLGQGLWEMSLRNFVSPNIFTGGQGLGVPFLSTQIILYMCCWLIIFSFGKK